MVYEGAGGAHVLTEAIFYLAALLSSLACGYKREFLTGPRLQNTLKMIVYCPLVITSKLKPFSNQKRGMIGPASILHN